MERTTDRQVEAALAALFRRRPEVIKPGLERMRAALAELPAGFATPRSVLVAGTNGKGTTTGTLWQLAVASGQRAGLFTSPHLWRFAERIQHSHATLREPELVAELEALEASLSPATRDALSFFELTTLLALRMFRKYPSDVAMFEVGLGGRWDSTNVTEPAVSVITSIGLDHQEFLGTTTAQIAREKAGVLRAGRPAIFGGPESADAAACAAVEAEAKAKGALLYVLGREFALEGDRVRLAMPGLPPLRVPLATERRDGPAFLKRNVALALAAFYALERDPERVRVAAERLAAGDAPVPPSHWARFQAVTGAPAGRAPRRLLLDVGHNPDGARALVGGLEETGQLARGKRPALVSILRDKDHEQILSILSTALDPILLFKSASERAWRPSDVAAPFRGLPFFDGVRAAFDALPPDDGGPVVVTGSVFGVGEALQAFGLAPWA